MGRRGRTIWDDDKIALLKKLWVTDLMTIEIAKRFGVRPSSIEGVARRLGLPYRHTFRKRQQKQQAEIGTTELIANADEYRIRLLQSCPVRIENGVKIIECPPAWCFPSRPRW